MSYRIRYTQEVQKNDIPSLDGAIAVRIADAIEKKLVVNPKLYGKSLRYELKGARSLRVGDWRVIYFISGNEVIVLAIQHRKNAYQGLSLE